MASLHPREPSIDAPADETRTADLGSDTADDIVGALRSDTARQIIRRLHTEPAPASDLATDLDTTLQNIQYHLRKLQAADLVEDAGTWYSSRGKPMPVYAPAVSRLTLSL